MKAQELTVGQQFTIPANYSPSVDPSQVQMYECMLSSAYPHETPCTIAKHVGGRFANEICIIRPDADVELVIVTKNAATA